MVISSKGHKKILLDLKQEIKETTRITFIFFCIMYSFQKVGL